MVEADQPPREERAKNSVEAAQKPSPAQSSREWTELVKGFAQASAVTLGSLALVGAGVDSATNLLPYADPQQWIVAGLALIGIGAGQRIPSLIKVGGSR